MFDWRKKIDDQEEAQRQERARVEAEAKVKYLAEQERERQSNIRKLSQFKCHVCSISSLKPAMKSPPYNGTLDYDGEPRPDWSKPGDLWSCTKCKDWTCGEHIHKDICQTCAEKM